MIVALFRRRRQTAPVLHAAAPGLSDEQLLALIESKLAEAIGADGKWTLTRREDGDTDTIFHTMLSKNIAAEVTAAVIEGRETLRGAPGTEPSALSWDPAPIAVWVDSSAPASVASTQSPDSPAESIAAEANTQLAR